MRKASISFDIGAFYFKKNYEYLLKTYEYTFAKTGIVVFF